MQALNAALYIDLVCAETRFPMATLTIRNADYAFMERLRVPAALQGRPVEEEARHILCKVLGGVTGPALWERARNLFARGEDSPPPAFD